MPLNFFGGLFRLAAPFGVISKNCSIPLCSLRFGMGEQQSSLRVQATMALTRRPAPQTIQLLLKY